MPNPYNPDRAQDDRDARLGVSADDVIALERTTRRFARKPSPLDKAANDLAYIRSVMERAGSDGLEGDHLP